MSWIAVQKRRRASLAAAVQDAGAHIDAGYYSISNRRLAVNEPFLSARGLSKTYAMGRRTLEVLRGVDLAVSRGEFLALRGASGAGKSTLLHLIGGLDSPNAGEIFFNDRNLAKFSEGELTQFRNRRVGFVFQAYHLLPELT